MSEGQISRRRVLAAGSAVAAGSLLVPRSAGAGTGRPASAQAPPYPHTDPNNDGGWVLRDQLSDEFTGTGVDTGRWNTSPNSWRFWRWNSDNVTVSNGTAKIRSTWNPHNRIDTEPTGWPQTVTGGISPNGTHGVGHPAYVTTEYNTGGDADLILTSDMPYEVSCDGRVTGLANGTYVFRARIYSSGGQSDARMSVTSFDADDGNARMGRHIRESSGYVSYEVPDIPVTSGEATLIFLASSSQGTWMRIRDVEFVRQGSTTNLAPNPGFRQRRTLNCDSGMLRSRQRIRYGYFEARIKASTILQGNASAFWLAVTEPCGGGRWTELDVVEMVNRSKPRELSDSSHIWTHPCLDGAAIHEPNRWEIGEPPNADFHIYALEWNEERIAWYADGEVLRTRETQPYFTQPLVVQISQRPANTDDSSLFPSTMEIDYVRVWQQEGTPLIGPDPCECSNPWQGFTDTFDSTPIGQVPALYTAVENGGTISVAESPGGAGRALSMVRAAGGTGTLHTVRPFNATAEPLRFSADVRLSQRNVAFGMSVRGGSGGPTARIRFAPGGGIEYEENGTLVATSLTYQADRWHHVEISIGEQRRFAAYLDGERIVANVPITPAGRFDEVTLGIGDQANGSVAIDNVTLTPG